MRFDKTTAYLLIYYFKCIKELPLIEKFFVSSSNVLVKQGTKIYDFVYIAYADVSLVRRKQGTKDLGFVSFAYADTSLVGLPVKVVNPFESFTTKLYQLKLIQNVIFYCLLLMTVDLSDSLHIEN